MKLVFIILLGICTTVHAQHFSELGRFSIPYEQACAPVTISISTHDNFGDVPRSYIYEPCESSEPCDVTDTTYTYTGPGIYQIVQITGEEIQQKTDTLTFEVVAPTPPTFDIFKCTATQVQVEITDSYYEYHVVKFTNNDSVIVFPNDPSPSFNYGTSVGNVQVIGYFDNSYPNCGQTFQSFTISEPVEPVINSVSINEQCQLDYFIELDVTADPMTKYSVSYQQGTSSYIEIYSGKLQSNNTFPIDLDPSITDYCVQVNTINACSGGITAGTEICNTFNSATFIPLNQAYASYTSNNDILLSFSPLTTKSVLIGRNYGDSTNFNFITETQNPYTDNIGAHYRPYYYQLSLVDTCGNVLNNLTLSAPFLRIIDKVRQTNEVEIRVTEPIHSLSTYADSIVIFNTDSSAAVVIPYQDRFVLPPGLGEQLNVTVRYTFTTEGINIYSNTVSTSYEALVYVPNAFTPNGDGLNDHVELFGLPDGPFEIIIFNRWGEAIHKAVDNNPVWDGTINSELAESGTYRYKLTFTLPDGEVKKQVGTFVLLKN